MLNSEGNEILLTLEKDKNKKEYIKSVNFSQTTTNNLNNNISGINNETISHIDIESKQFFFDDKKSIFTHQLNEINQTSHNYNAGFNKNNTSTNNNSLAISNLINSVGVLPKASDVIQTINNNIINNTKGGEKNNSGKKNTIFTRGSIIANCYDSSNNQNHFPILHKNFIKSSLQKNFFK